MLHMASILVQTLDQTDTHNLWLCYHDSHQRFWLKIQGKMARECVYKAEAGAPSWGCNGGRGGLSSSHRSALSCFWTPVIPFLAFYIEAISPPLLSLPPKITTELMGVSLLPHSSLKLPPHMTTWRRWVDWQWLGIQPISLSRAKTQRFIFVHESWDHMHVTFPSHCPSPSPWSPDPVPVICWYHSQSTDERTRTY